MLPPARTPMPDGSHPRAAAAPLPAPRPSAKVARVAAILACDDSRVRKLVRAGELEAHRVGLRGIRVYLDSVAAYQDARPVAPARARAPESPPPRRPRRAADIAAHEEALARLRALGVRV